MGRRHQAGRGHHLGRGSAIREVAVHDDGQRYRLLSEAEWEYAARAGSTTAYYWGDAIGKGNANCNGCGSRWDDNETAPVGSFPLNKFGLADMLGNVYQWVEDCYYDRYDGVPNDGSAWTSGDCKYRVARGGGWKDNPLKSPRGRARRGTPPTLITMAQVSVSRGRFPSSDPILVAPSKR